MENITNEPIMQIKVEVMNASTLVIVNNNMLKIPIKVVKIDWSRKIFNGL